MSREVRLKAQSAPPTPEPAAPCADGPAPADLGRLALRADPDPGLLRAFLHGLYDLAWVVVGILGLPILAWKVLRQAGFGRGLLERLGRGLGRVSPGALPRVLVHGVSVGEVKGARPIVRSLEERFPGIEVFVCTSTDTGVEVARQLYGAGRVLRFPADLSPFVGRFLRRVRPDLVVLIELEVWPNFLRGCNRRGVPVAVVNGRITQESHTNYMFFRHLLPQFERVSFFCVQAPEYAERFLALGVEPERILITGSVKADGLERRTTSAGPELARLLGGRPGQLVVVAGSTHEPEERLLVEAVARGAPGARLVLVPRHPPRCDELERTLGGVGPPPQRLTVLRAGEAPDPDRPVLVDTIGELEAVYALADLVFVGGSLAPRGGQNLLEPAVQEKPVLFGPSVENFLLEAELLLEAGAARQVSGPEELAPALRALAAAPEERRCMGAAGAAAVASQRGATERTVHALAGLCLEELVEGRLAGASPAGTIR